MTDQHLPDDSNQNTSHGTHARNQSERRGERQSERESGRQSGRQAEPCPPDGNVHLLFGSIEELLADLGASGGPEGGIVRVERIVRSQATALGGTATLGIALTARRATEISETLSAWVIVTRIALDPWGHPISPTQAQEARRYHHEAQRLLSALVADAGYTPRSGLYLLSDECYGFTATVEPLSTSHAMSHSALAHTSALTDQPAEQAERSVEGETSRQGEGDTSGEGRKESRKEESDEGGPSHA